MFYTEFMAYINVFCHFVTQDLLYTILFYGIHIVLQYIPFCHC